MKMPPTLLGLLLALVLLAPSLALAQDAAWDPEEIARLSERSAKTASALSYAMELLAKVDDLSRRIGRFGTLSKLDFTRLGVVDGLRGAGPEIANPTIASAASGAGKIASFQDASAFVAKVATPAAGIPATSAAAQVRQRLAALHRRALEDGYALAMHTRESLSMAPSRAQLLVTQASSATDLRADLAADTAASMAVLEQLTSLKAMLASLLEIEATRKLGYAPQGIAR